MFVIKAEVPDPTTDTYVFSEQKTMYGGKRIKVGDLVFVFASENDGGQGLVASGIVSAAASIPLKPHVARQTPRVSITVRRTALCQRGLGRSALKPCTDWHDGRPETELNFKLYRQATNKIVGISKETSLFLETYFQDDPLQARTLLREQIALLPDQSPSQTPRQSPHPTRPGADEIAFHTDRLVVRRWRDTDLRAIFAVYGDAETMRWVGDGEPISREDCSRWIQVTHANYSTRGYGMFAVVDKIDGKVIGFCGLVHPGGQLEPELKYAYLRAHRQRGFASEVAAGMLRYGAIVHRLEKIIATAAPGNTASHKVLLKAGMQRGEARANADGSHTLLFCWQADKARPEQSHT